MRLIQLTLNLFLLQAFTIAWTPQDHEIFRLRDELVAHEGPNTTFYSFLGAPSSASLDEINKAYRKKSRQLHPDKAIPALLAKRSAPKPESSKDKDKSQAKPGVKVQKGPSQKERSQIAREANERYARLGVIANILRGPGRDRYDHFLSNGFPRWRGTGYYYARFRPGLLSVVLGLLVVFGGAMHYGAMYLGWKRHKDFVDRYIAHARKMAWGNESGIPGLDPSSISGSGAASPPEDVDQDSGMPLNRAQKRQQEKESRKKNNAKTAKSARSSAISRPVDGEPISQNPSGARKKVIAENGKVLIVDSEGNVFLEEQTSDGQTHELLLDPDEIPMPSVFQTALFRLPVWMYSQTMGRVLGPKSGVGPDEPLIQNGEITVNSPEAHADEVVDSASAINSNAEARKRKSKAKAKNK